MTEGTLIVLTTVIVVVLGGYWYKWKTELEVALEQRT